MRPNGRDICAAIGVGPFGPSGQSGRTERIVKMLKRNEDEFCNLVNSFVKIIESITDSCVDEVTFVFNDSAYVYYHEGGIVEKYEKKETSIVER